MIDLQDLIVNGHNDVEFGTVAFFLKKHAGGVTTVDTQKIHTHKVANNTKALEIILGIFKAMAAAKDSGNVTLTVTFNKGDANKVMVQDIKHVTEKEWG